MPDVMNRSADADLVRASQTEGKPALDRAGGRLGGIREHYIDKVLQRGVARRSSFRRRAGAA